MWHWGSRDTGLYLEVNTPGQRVALPIPQAELPVMATSEEAVLEGMCAQSPELVCVALQQSICCHLCPAPTALPASSLSPWPPNLDHRGESLGQISPQQCILRGSHQQLRAQPLSNGPHSPKVFRNLEWWQKVRGPLALRRPPPSLNPVQPSPQSPGGPPTQAPTVPAGGPAHHHSARSHPAGDTGRKWNLREHGPGPQSRRSLLAKSWVG